MQGIETRETSVLFYTCKQVLGIEMSVVLGS